MTEVIFFRGVYFTEPFHCLCCHEIISAKQFAYGRCCAYCDSGRCSTGFETYESGHNCYWKTLPDSTICPIEGWNLKLLLEEDTIG